MTVAFDNGLMLFIVLHPPVHNRRFSPSKNPTKLKATNEEVMIFLNVLMCVDVTVANIYHFRLVQHHTYLLGRITNRAKNQRW